MRKALLILVAALGTMAASAEGYTCTKCQAKVLKNDRFCPNCGARFTQPSLPQPQPERVPEPSHLTLTPAQSPNESGQSDYWHNVENHTPGHALPVPMGMLRGLAEITCSPLELFRCMSGVEVGLWEHEVEEKGNPFSFAWWTVMATPVATGIMGSVFVVADVGMGTLDFLSLGAIGNAYWDSDYRSPYVFERNWLAPDHPPFGVWP